MTPSPHAAESSRDPAATRIAYFSMEIALEPRIPTYSGVLGVLAGDMLHSAADLEIPMVVTLVYHHGYFRQKLDPQENQQERTEPWQADQYLEALEPRSTVSIEGRTVSLRAWRYWIRGISGHTVPVYLLDAAVPENSAWDQTLTDDLYGGDAHYCRFQGVILGMGGAKLLLALGYTSVTSASKGPLDQSPRR